MSRGLEQAQNAVRPQSPYEEAVTSLGRQLEELQTNFARLEDKLDKFRQLHPEKAAEKQGPPVSHAQATNVIWSYIGDAIKLNMRMTDLFDTLDL